MVFWQLTIDANDPGHLTGFWEQALGWSRVPPTTPETTWWAHYRRRLGDEPAFDNRLFDPDGVLPPLWFQQVPEDKAGKNRLHLDLLATGRNDTLGIDARVAIVDARVAELVAAGATVRHSERGDDPGEEFYYVTLLDPEGNEFCVT
jgi:hypothetical protein